MSDTTTFADCLRELGAIANSLVFTVDDALAAPGSQPNSRGVIQGNPCSN
jgi:hypothetical protein